MQINHDDLPSVANAQLPASYENAKTALANCSSMDECKDWADKAKALASYARQSQDESLRKMAMRIQARVIRRAGELLKQIMPATGAHLKRAATDTLSRNQAGYDAGFLTSGRHRPYVNPHYALAVSGQGKALERTWDIVGASPRG